MGRCQRLTALRALAALDLTDLTDNCTPEAVSRLIARARTRHGEVAAICVWPRFVARASAALHGSGVRIASVINFPFGEESIDRAVIGTIEALRDGASEIDLVVPYKALARGDEKIVFDMILAVRRAIPFGSSLKTILETGELNNAALIQRAAELAIEAGANFLKTSTGKTPVSATPEAARILLETIKASGARVGFKASGGIRTLADAELYLALADEILGAGWAAPETFRFGASGLLDALLAVLDEGL